MSKGTLFVVATPIGNLEDVTLRALRVLKEVDYILAEDTRVALRLLSHYDIHTKVVRMDAHTERGGVTRVSTDLASGMNIALVSDAGTPAISDPGVRLVQEVRSQGYTVRAVPGPSSLTAALSIAGLPADTVLFLGFAPHKKGRKTFVAHALAHSGTVVFFESTHRIVKLLQEIALVAPEREVFLARELTKMYEEVVRGTPEELLARMRERPETQKGEFVVLLHA